MWDTEERYAHCVHNNAVLTSPWGVTATPMSKVSVVHWDWRAAPALSRAPRINSSELCMNWLLSVTLLAGIYGAGFFGDMVVLNLEGYLHGIPRVWHLTQSRGFPFWLYSFAHWDIDYILVSERRTSIFKYLRTSSTAGTTGERLSCVHDYRLSVYKIKYERWPSEVEPAQEEEVAGN